MILAPESYPSSRQEAMESGWICEGTYFCSKIPPFLFSEKMKGGYYVSAASFTATGDCLEGMFALWVKLAPLDGFGRPVSYHTVEGKRVVREEAE